MLASSVFIAADSRRSELLTGDAPYRLDPSAPPGLISPEGLGRE